MPRPFRPWLPTTEHACSNAVGLLLGVLPLHSSVVGAAPLLHRCHTPVPLATTAPRRATADRVTCQQGHHARPHSSPLATARCPGDRWRLGPGNRGGEEGMNGLVGRQRRTAMDLTGASRNHQRHAPSPSTHPKHPHGCHLVIPPPDLRPSASSQ